MGLRFSEGISKKMNPRILVVDDERAMRLSLSTALSKIGYEVTSAASAEQAISQAEKGVFEVILLDYKLPGISGLEAIPIFREKTPEAVIIILTGFHSKGIAIEAIRKGAYDYFTKPFEMTELEIVIKRALEKQKLISEIKSLRERLIGISSNKLVGESHSIEQIRHMVKRIAPLDSNVLITGESGTGKELIADLIHYNSPRASGPLVKINCAAIPETLLESELFGYEKGAFTGASTQKPGKFELANKGTILLDEIGDMPLKTQVKILRVVETKQVERLGGKKPISFNARIICTTNQNLSELIKRKKFRDDLYYRINAASIHLPALRDRKEDIPLLVQHYLNELNLKLGLKIRGLHSDAMDVFLAYDWPGNIRELIHVLEKAAILSTGPLIDACCVNLALEKHVPLEINNHNAQAISLSETLQKVEKNLIIQALKRTKGMQIKAAELLGLTPKNLWKKIKKHNIDVSSISRD